MTYENKIEFELSQREQAHNASDQMEWTVDGDVVRVRTTRIIEGKNFDRGDFVQIEFEVSLEWAAGIDPERMDATTLIILRSDLSNRVVRGEPSRHWGTPTREMREKLLEICHSEVA